MIKNFKNIVVLGAGKSGIGAAVLAKKNNLNVLLCDDSNISKESTNTLREYGVEYYQVDYTT
jgi:UDP-N-acetylmuramoylalanine--D-glutamate ligase